jgi:clan AA aspartic protease (TIGR02281 family)
MGQPDVLGRVEEDNMKKGALAALAAAVLAAVSAASADDEIPLKGHGRALVVEATLNDRFTGKFLLDTGATFCVVTKDTARNAMIKGRTGGKKLRLMTAAGPIEATLAEARKVELGSSSARDVEVAVVEDDPTPGFAGLIGLSFLGRFKYSIDSEQGVLRLEK